MVKPSTTETRSSSSSSHSMSPLQTFLVHLICGIGLGAGFWVAHNVYSINLVSRPSDALRLIWVLLSEPNCFSSLQLFSEKSRQSLVFQSCGTRPTGAPCWGSCKCFRSYCFGCTCGHSVCGIRYRKNTFDWVAFNVTVHCNGNKLAAFEFCQTSFVLSYYILLIFYLAYWQFVPVASVYGSSWEDWQHIFAHTKPNGSVDYMICLPVHGAVIGAWFGAWSMPLDWERPWQVMMYLMMLVSVKHLLNLAGMTVLCELWSHGRVSDRNGGIFWLCTHSWKTTASKRRLAVK
ncbi:hypothetical protein Patl1_34798 [Pistacia atlantica]|uniref:Uncharacterized protein n=1 Tax=Pistacia atlantica TaxID=434234 RepID=A0ACC0ZPN4_9ROSI|nr:hypothetical protein Patl1_34798 [Pistacia atlantica]